MSECKLDHSLEDVHKKLEEQAPFLPEDLYSRFKAFLTSDVDQATLNEAFHLLKKYDLASAEEQQARNARIEALIQG
ncbi:hypothetical protein GCM10010965_11210 [Caldalkalibacillus thermarum]|uniref:group-specific protein n=1 Tax=Caldalkalibacillus thermarum TaxID=296745 RepID=UPI0016662319|nr:group-specific protein [Caldalkalibacillus thermarum]GGK19960.1 hypothetical protein GCM10010965_11210 [Caldalkalibacillus thermarum]